MLRKAVRAITLAVLLSAHANASCLKTQTSVPLLTNHSCLGTTAPVPPPFSPGDETGLQFWFASTDNITKDGSNNVSAWVDKTVNAYSATATSGKQPVWTDAYSPNGNPCLVFDGVDDFMEFATGVNFTAGGVAQSFFGTIKSIAKAGTFYNTAFLLRTAVSNSNFALVDSNDSTFGNLFWGIFAGNLGLRSATGDVRSALTNFQITYSGGTTTAPGSWTATLAHVAQTITATTSTGTPSGNHNYIGEWSPTGSALSWKGAVCEWGAYDHVLSGTIATKLNTYQTTKWGN